MSENVYNDMSTEKMAADDSSSCYITVRRKRTNGAILHIIAIFESLKKKSMSSIHAAQLTCSFNILSASSCVSNVTNPYLKVK